MKMMLTDERAEETQARRETHEQLVADYQRGDGAALDRLLARNTALVRSRAQAMGGFVGGGREAFRHDMENQGLACIWKAARDYRPEAGSAFQTYACYVVDQGIRRWLANNARVVRVPIHVGQIVGRLLTADEMLTGRLGRAPTLEELAAETRLTLAQVKNARRTQATVNHTVSLDADLGADAEGRPLLARVADRLAECPATVVARAEDRRLLRRGLQRLSARERTVLELRYGLGHDRARSQREVSEMSADRLGRFVTGTRIGQLQAMAETKLRSILQALESPAPVAAT